MSYESRHISISINSSAAEVYEFASNPENLPKWAAGLSGSVKNVNGEWIAESPMGTFKVKFADKNMMSLCRLAKPSITLCAYSRTKMAAN